MSCFKFQPNIWLDNSHVTFERDRIRFPFPLPLHSGIYECEAKNRAGSFRGQIVLEVEEPYSTSKGLLAGTRHNIFYSVKVMKISSSQKNPRYQHCCGGDPYLMWYPHLANFEEEK